MLYDRIADTAAAAERRLELTWGTLAPEQSRLSRDLEAFRRASLLQHRQKFQDAINQQLVNLEISLVGQASKVRDKVQS